MPASADRGLLDGEGGLTDAGRDLREQIERRTDHAERDVVARLGDRADELFALLAADLAVPGGQGRLPHGPRTRCSPDP